MNLSRFLTLSLILPFIFLLTACKKDSHKPNVTVYVAGVNGDTAIYWQNGSAHLLSNGISKAQSNQIAFSNGSVYISGDDVNKGNDAAVYWNQGLPNFLTLPANTISSLANSVFILGSDVYMAGFVINYNGLDAALWKNGVPSIIDSTNAGECKSVVVSGGHVYICGNSLYNLGNITATVWKDGLRQTLTSGEMSDANSIYVSGNDVYVAGFHVSGITGAAALWKNGVLTDLSTNNAAAFSVSVANGIVYVAGYESVNGVQTATIWENGSPHHMTGGYQAAEGSSVYISGGDVYLAGFVENNYTTKACYWKNGQLFIIGNPGSVANSIVVQ